MECITLRSLTFTYPKAHMLALDAVDLVVQSGEFVTVTGPSGCGKSTLLRHLKTPLTPHGIRTGDILFEGVPLEEVDLRTQTARIGFVMQDPESQIVTDQVWHELAFGLENLGYDTPTIRRRVAEMASFFGIEDWFRRDVRELSGGQKQLLNLAAVMAMQPSVLILDEPTGQLDPIAATDFLETVFRINRELGTTVLLTEHRLEEALPMSDRVVILDAGRVIASGPPSEVGEDLLRSGHPMSRSMPAAMRISAAFPYAAGMLPVTVREGRSWLATRQAACGLGTVPPEPVPPAHGDTPALELDEVWFRYEKELPDVLRGLSLCAYEGEFLAILGGNGVGKSTALSVAAGLRRPYRGHVRILGKDFSTIKEPYQGLLGVLPQDPRTLFVKKTVREDLEDVLEKSDSFQRLSDIVSQCRITELLDRHPYDLSGGECQRAALAKVLLRSPKILLLDEPTKGLDQSSKEELAQLLEALCRSGACMIMVSHDVEFCAQYAHRCVMVFDGMTVGEGTPRAFFGGNSFYTTAANRIARTFLPEAVTVEDVIAACAGPVLGEYTFPPEKSEPGNKKVRRPDKSVFKVKSCQTLQENQQTDCKREKRRHIPFRRVLAALFMVLVLVPLTIFLGIRLFDDRKYMLVSLFVLLEALVPFALLFEQRKPQARELVVIAVLCAAGVAGRAAFAALPSFKPVLAMVILAGVALGGETGFLIGAVTMLTSNFFFGQGPWTPWQMFAMGIIGFLAGAIFHKREGRTRKLVLCAFGAASALLIYGGIMNPASVLMYQPEPTWEMLVAAYLTGFPVDAVHALSTVFFLWLFANPYLEKMRRIKIKYGLLD